MISRFEHGIEIGRLFITTVPKKIRWFGYERVDAIGIVWMLGLWFIQIGWSES